MLDALVNRSFAHSAVLRREHFSCDHIRRCELVLLLAKRHSIEILAQVLVFTLASRLVHELDQPISRNCARSKALPVTANMHSVTYSHPQISRRIHHRIGLDEEGYASVNQSLFSNTFAS